MENGNVYRRRGRMRMLKNMYVLCVKSYNIVPLCRRSNMKISTYTTQKRCRRSVCCCRCYCCSMYSLGNNGLNLTTLCNSDSVIIESSTDTRVPIVLELTTILLFAQYRFYETLTTLSVFRVRTLYAKVH